MIEVQPMNEEESLALLLARIPALQSGESAEDENNLVRALEYIPLAISQAGSYIASHLSRVTVSRFIYSVRASRTRQIFFDMRTLKTSSETPAFGIFVMSGRRRRIYWR